MDSTNRVPDQQQVLEAADRVARAAYLWIRHGNTVRLPATGPGARRDMIAGILFGLCGALDLDDRHALLSAYAYALLDGDAGEALGVAQSMLRCRDNDPFRVAYQNGLQAADDLIALISFPESGGSQPLPI